MQNALNMAGSAASVLALVLFAWEYFHLHDKRKAIMLAAILGIGAVLLFLSAGLITTPLVRTQTLVQFVDSLEGNLTNSDKISRIELNQTQPIQAEQHSTLRKFFSEFPPSHKFALYLDGNSANVRKEDSLTDADLLALRGESRIIELGLNNNTFITDTGVAHLAGMPLKRLTLQGTSVTKQLLQTLGDIPTLTSIELSNIRIDNASLNHLSRLNLKD